MKTRISRQEARRRIAAARVAGLRPEQRADLLLDWWSIEPSDEGWEQLSDDLKVELSSKDEPPLDATSTLYDPLLILARMHETVGTLNSWLETILATEGLGNFEVEGDREPMVRCPCCDYYTLLERGGYEVCQVCLWEDDGCEDLERQSGPNHLSLREGRANFARLGACAPDMSKHVVREPHRVYPRGD